jgi:hypothetical protein
VPLLRSVADMLLAIILEFSEKSIAYRQNSAFIADMLLVCTAFPCDNEKTQGEDSLVFSYRIIVEGNCLVCSG